MSTASQKVTLMCDGTAYTIEVVDPEIKTCIPEIENKAGSTSASEPVGDEDCVEDMIDIETQEGASISQSTESEMEMSVVKDNLGSRTIQPVIEASFSVNGTHADDIRWTRELTLLLITERGKRNHLFEMPNIRKNKLWEVIAKKVNQISQFTYTGAHCCDKWRSLLQRYRLIKNKMKDPRHRPITWEYFDSLDLILGYKPVTKAQPRRRPFMHNLKSLQHRRPKLDFNRSVTRSVTVTQPNREQVVHTDTPRAGNSSNSTRDFLHPFSALENTRNIKIVEDPPWFKKYLRHRTEEENRRSIREERQREEERKRWLERKDLEEKKIAAMSELNKSICLLLDKLK